MSNESKCPVMHHDHARGTIANQRWWPESVEPENAPPEPTLIQSYGKGFQLRRSVQYNRLSGTATGHRKSDDDIAGVVAR